MGSLTTAVQTQSKTYAKTVTLAPNEAFNFDSTTSLLVITSKGAAFTGSSAFLSGYGVDQSGILPIAHSVALESVGVGGSILDISKSQWGGMSITNKTPNNLAIHFFWIAPETI